MDSRLPVRTLIECCRDIEQGRHRSGFPSPAVEELIASERSRQIQEIVDAFRRVCALIWGEDSWPQMLPGRNADDFFA
jgi:hypothetical protein